MKLTIERDAALKAIARVVGVAPRKTVIPIVTHVLLSATADGLLSLSATDLDMRASVTAPCTVAQPGSTTVPAVLLYDLVRNLPPGGEVELEVNAAPNQLALRCGRTKGRLPMLPAADFPMILPDATASGGPMASATLNRLLGKVEFAISNEETRFYLMGAFLHIVATDDGRMLRAVATNGHRLAMCEAPTGDEFADFPAIIMPARMVDEARKLLDAEPQCTLRASSTKVEVAAGAATLASKLIDGTYPDYIRAVPLGNPHCFGVDVTDLTAALKRLMIVASDDGKTLKVEFEPGGLKLSNRSIDTGTVSEELEADYDGPPITMGLNARYLSEIATRIDGERMEMHLATGADAILVTAPTDKRLRFVLMPQRA